MKEYLTKRLKYITIVGVITNKFRYYLYYAIKTEMQLGIDEGLPNKANKAKLSNVTDR